jgi:acyl-coenzyme A synthetase/AMP-(fatty) acid ligase
MPLAVAEVAVFRVPEAQWGTPVAADNERVEAGFQKLSGVLVLDELPRNVAGKTLRRELREMVTSGEAGR